MAFAENLSPYARAQPHARPACREALRHPPSREPLGARRGDAWDRHDEAHSRRHRRAAGASVGDARALLRKLRHVPYARRLRNDAAGNKTDHYCKWCYDRGDYTYETTMEAMIEDCAPRLAKNTGMTLDEAASLMGAVLPQLERWRAVRETSSTMERKHANATVTKQLMP